MIRKLLFHRCPITVLEMLTVFLLGFVSAMSIETSINNVFLTLFGPSSRDRGWLVSLFYEFVL